MSENDSDGWGMFVAIALGLWAAFEVAKMLMEG